MLSLASKKNNNNFSWLKRQKAHSAPFLLLCRIQRKNVEALLRDKLWS
ncbi:hypothetical protein D052_4521 [Vibrio parahaemolyticus 10290]|nr:hypothetical protein D052_4521 [Vibrio parahaemolyticus 10290]